MKMPRAQGLVGDLNNLKNSPLRADSDIYVPKWRKAVERMAMVLKCSPEQLFTEEQIRAACGPDRRKGYHFAISASDVQFIADGARQLALPADVLLEREETRRDLEIAVVDV